MDAESYYQCTYHHDLSNALNLKISFCQFFILNGELYHYTRFSNFSGDCIDYDTVELIKENGKIIAIHERVKSHTIIPLKYLTSDCSDMFISTLLSQLCRYFTYLNSNMLTNKIFTTKNLYDKKIKPEQLFSSSICFIDPHSAEIVILCKYLICTNKNYKKQNDTKLKQILINLLYKKTSDKQKKTCSSVRCCFASSKEYFTNMNYSFMHTFFCTNETVGEQVGKIINHFN